MKIALLGHGTVGQGVDKIVSERVRGVEVARILELPGRLGDERMTSDFDDILQDESIELVVECMGGLEPAHSHIMDALAAGKGVVTSNKAVVAAYFQDFVSQAKTSRASLFIEATCAGGIPWISSIEKVRRIDEVRSLSGIMNGTTNFILDAMSREGRDFADVLAQAQELGYAERDPSADVDGTDVQNKTIIAASVAFDVACRKDIPTTGIRTITKDDMDFFARRGMTVKLLGRACQRDGRYAACVGPVALSSHTPEAQVPGNFNLVSLDATTVGTLKFYGQGAGMLPTGNAMVQDILDYAAGRRPSYDFASPLAFDDSLMRADYVLRSGGAMSLGEPLGQDRYLVRDLTASSAREVFERALASDPTSFIAALDAEVEA